MLMLKKKINNQFSPLVHQQVALSVTAPFHPINLPISIRISFSVAIKRNVSWLREPKELPKSLDFGSSLGCSSPTSGGEGPSQAAEVINSVRRNL